MRRRAWACSALLVTTTAVGAQESLLPTTGWGVGSTISAWHFSTPIAQSGGAVADIAEMAIPFRVRSVFGRWSVDLSGAGAFGAVHTSARPSGSDSDEGDDGDQVFTIFGPTDVKLRVTGPVVGDNLLVTIGLNLPTGKVGLDGDETTTLQAIGAPAVRMPVGSFGTGAGATLGAIRAFEGDDWAVAVGGSLEQRTEYSPIALLLSGGKAETQVTPGTAAHLTLGLDRALGESRFSTLLVGDVFSKDQVRFTGGGTSESNSDFQLGPQVTLTSKIDFGSVSWRESAFAVAARLRGEFSDSTGAKVSGSSGTYLEASIGGVRGGPEGKGFVVAADARWHSGLKFTDALVGAAVTAVGVSLGYEAVQSSSTTRFIVHGQYGTFDTGTTSTSGFGVTFGLSIGARREAR